MEAMVLEEFGTPLKMRQIPEPILDPQKILVKVKADGVCRTDIKRSKGKMSHVIISLPHIMGHEVVGEVVELGKAVDGISPGDKGVVYFYKACRNCEICLRGQENICPNVKRFGFELPEGCAEYMKVPAYNFCPFQGDTPFSEMVVVGYSPGDSWPVDTVPFHFYEWNAIGCRASTRRELSEVVKLVEARKIKSVVSKTYSLDQANEALKELSKGDIIGRIVLVQD